MAYATQAIEADYREVDNPEGDADIEVNQNPDLDDPNLSLANRVRSGDISPMQAAFIAAGGVYGYTFGGNEPFKQAACAAVGAFGGSLLFALVHEQGWLE